MGKKFDGGRYFDVSVEYAKADPNDTYIRSRIANRGPERASIHVLPTVWFRNTWSWSCKYEDCVTRPSIKKTHARRLLCAHSKLHNFEFVAATRPDRWLFTENETNTHRLFGGEKGTRGAKDHFHDFVIHGDAAAVNGDDMQMSFMQS
jgi:hypothetical protein